MVVRRLRLRLRTLDMAEVPEGLTAGDKLSIGAVAQPGQRVRPDRKDTASALMPVKWVGRIRRHTGQLGGYPVCKCST